MSPRRILVPLDGRRASETALPAAMKLARESGGRLYLLTEADMIVMASIRGLDATRAEPSASGSRSPRGRIDAGAQLACPAGDRRIEACP
jgi:nucleotide-binding universal stress UspA family protein